MDNDPKKKNKKKRYWKKKKKKGSDVSKATSTEGPIKDATVKGMKSLKDLNSWLKKRSKV
jgi:hypothetical protein